MQITAGSLLLACDTSLICLGPEAEIEFDSVILAYVKELCSGVGAGSGLAAHHYADLVSR